MCEYCKQNAILQGLLGPANVLEADAAELAEKVSFTCPYGCEKKNLRFLEL